MEIGGGEGGYTTREELKGFRNYLYKRDGVSRGGKDWGGGGDFGGGGGV